MKIALVRKNYTPYGGAENYLRLMARKLASLGHEVDIFSATEQTDPDFRIRRIKTCRKPSFLSNIMFAVRSREALQKSAPDFIISFERTCFQDLYRAGDGCHKEWLLRRSMTEPFLRRVSFKLNPHHLILLSLESSCFQRSRFIVANSMMVKDDIVRNYDISPDRISVIYNGVDTQLFRPAGDEQKKAIKDLYKVPERHVVLFVGADFRRKGVAALLKAFSLMDLQDTRLIIAGRSAGDPYVSAAMKLGIDGKVSFLGAEREVKNLYAMSDVFVLPTIYDPFSNATLEAMSSGLPVITTKQNGVSEIIENGVQGYIVDPSDATLMAEKITSALSDSGRMGKRSRARAEEYPVDDSINRFVEIICDGRRGSA